MRAEQRLVAFHRVDQIRQGALLAVAISVLAQQPAGSFARDQLDVTQVPVGHDRAGLIVLDRTGGDPEEPGQLLLR